MFAAWFNCLPKSKPCRNVAPQRRTRPVRMSFRTSCTSTTPPGLPSLSQCSLSCIPTEVCGEFILILHVDIPMDLYIPLRTFIEMSMLLWAPASQCPLYHSETPIDNTRYHAVEFTASGNATLHGIAGYFDTTLYKDIKLSMCYQPHHTRFCI